MPEIYSLENGLKVATEKMSDTETVSIGVWVNVGSRYEEKSKNGLAHFLEHMAFKGTKTRSALQIAQEFDNIGGAFNAHTSREQTVFYSKVLKDKFDIAGDIISDIILNSSFDQVELERERKVVEQEYTMAHDTPDDIIFDRFQETAFPDQALGRPILGSIDNIRKFTQQDLKDYTKKYYTGSHMVISVAGNIDHDDIRNFAKDKFSKLDSSLSQKKESAKYVGGEYTEKRDIEQVHLILGFQGISYHYPEIYAIKLLSNILGGGMSSRLFQEIREKRGIAYSVSSHHSSYADAGIFSIYGSTTKEYINEMVDVLCLELKKVASKVTEEELERAKNQARAAILMGMEGSAYRADKIGNQISSFGRVIPVEEVLDKIDATNTKQLSSIMESLIETQPTVASIGNVEGLDLYNKINQNLSA